MASLPKTFAKVDIDAGDNISEIQVTTEELNDDQGLLYDDVPDGLNDVEHEEVKVVSGFAEDEESDKHLNVEIEGNVVDEDDFENMGLSDELVQGIYEYGFETPSKIQMRAVPTILRNRAENFVGQSPSGTGKTGAFAISMLGCIDTSIDMPQALLIAPTRELARQIYDVITALGKYTGINTLLLLAGTQIDNKTNFTQQLIVGTPGKLLMSLQCNSWRTEKLRILVWDEADHLAMEDTENIEGIISILNSKCPNLQKCLFSATFEDKNILEKFVPQPRNSVLVDKKNLVIDPTLLPQFWISATGDGVAQSVEDSIEKRYETLHVILEHLQTQRIIIFCSTRSVAEFLLREVQSFKLAYSSGCLHGKIPREERDQIMDDFRVGSIRLLITTNVLARGIDVLNVSLVVNFDLPINFHSGTPDVETYLHRVGRTARFGNSGLAINMVYNKTTKAVLKQIADHFSIAMAEIKKEELQVWCEHFTMTQMDQKKN